MIQHADATAFAAAESAVIAGLRWLRLAIETIGAGVVGVGVVVAIAGFARETARGVTGRYLGIRLSLARFLAVALELQLAADILSTAIAPSWDQIGKLGAIAVIRTALNYFLTREMESERAQMQEGGERR